jgi:acetyl-CoA C-acetyltransferase
MPYLNKVYIIAASRTPMGSFLGSLAQISAPELGAFAVKDVLKKVQINVHPDSIVMGNVLQANVGQAPARQVAHLSDLPNSVCATTVNKVCASGMKAIDMIASDIALGKIDSGIAGGMESMSQVPYYQSNIRTGKSFGHLPLTDGLLKDGLTDVSSGKSMGECGDIAAEKFGFSREDQDAFAIESYLRATKAYENGNFDKEICSINIPQKKGDPITIDEDESYKKVNFEKMKSLKPAFTKEGSVTAANASSMNDGASALFIASEQFSKTNQYQPIAQVIDYAEAEQEAIHFTSTPVLAIQKLLDKNNLRISDIDFFEINEAFSLVPMIAMKELNIPHEKVNSWGGAVALGHPLGSSGSRIVVTLVHQLQQLKGKLGIAAICNGGGGASAILIQSV